MPPALAAAMAVLLFALPCKRRLACHRRPCCDTHFTCATSHGCGCLHDPLNSSHFARHPADALNQPFGDGEFDLVWSMESGEHMPGELLAAFESQSGQDRAGEAAPSTLASDPQMIC